MDVALEQAIVDLLPDEREEAVNKYQEATGAKLADAVSAVRAIAVKHGLDNMPFWTPHFVLVGVGGAMGWITLGVYLAVSQTKKLEEYLFFIGGSALLAFWWVQRSVKERRQQMRWIAEGFKDAAEDAKPKTEAKPTMELRRPTYLRTVLLPCVILGGVFCLVMFANLALSFVVPEDVSRLLLRNVGAFLLLGGGGLVAAICISLNGIWLYRTAAVGGYLRTVVIPFAVLCFLLVPAVFVCSIISRSRNGAEYEWGDPRELALMGAALAAVAGVVLHGLWMYRTATAGGYIRTVIVPLLAFAILMFVVACVLMVIFQRRDGAYYVLGDPWELAKMGAALAASGFLLVNGVWFYRTTPAGGYFRKAIHAVGWTAVCVALYFFVGSPTADHSLWPYYGESESTVSMTPRFAVKEKASYRRLVITEQRGFQCKGRNQENAEYTRHVFVIHIDLADGTNRQLHVDALKNRSYHYVAPGGKKVLGPLLDLPVALEWMHPDFAKEDQQGGLSIALERQARFWLDLIQSRGTEKPGIPGRFDSLALSRLEPFRVQNGGVPFVDITGSEKSSLEPDLPILYVGVPLTIVVWGIGLWMLLRYGHASKVKPDPVERSHPATMP